MTVTVLCVTVHVVEELDPIQEEVACCVHCEPSRGKHVCCHCLRTDAVREQVSTFTPSISGFGPKQQGPGKAEGGAMGKYSHVFIYTDSLSNLLASHTVSEHAV